MCEPASAVLVIAFPFRDRLDGRESFCAGTNSALWGRAVYGLISILVIATHYLASQGNDSLLAKAIGKDIKGKLSPPLYVIAIIATFFEQWVAGGLYVLVALMWLVPDRRIERVLGEKKI